jgi:hypothetical protein
MAHYNVILYVDTANVEQKYIDLCCNFGQAREIPNKDYRIYLDPKDTITWVGLSSTDPKDRVDIKFIKYEKQNNIFGEAIIPGDNGKPEMVNATVINNTNGENESYKIGFQVFNHGKLRQKAAYILDPKIKVNT